MGEKNCIFLEKLKKYVEFFKAFQKAVKTFKNCENLEEELRVVEGGEGR